MIRQVTHNTIKEILAINEEYVFEDCKASEDELLKELTAAIEELRKFIMDSKIKPEVKANLLGELIYRVAEDNDCSERKVSVMTASLRECMKDFGVMLRELSLSSHGRPELNMKILEWVISRGMDSVVDYDEDSSIIAVELIKSILKEPNNQANRITQFFDLVDTAFDTRINGESPDLLPMVNELLKAGISSELAAELYYESPHWELFEHATQDIDGLRKLEKDGTEMDIMNLIYILRNAIKSSDRNYVLSALKFLESGLNEYAKRNAESLSVNGMKLLQESFSGMLKKIEKNLVPALDVVYAIPYGLSPEQAIRWLAERFPEFPKPPASPEIDFFNYQNDFNVENDFDMEYLMEPPQSERPQVFPAEGQSGMTNNIPSRSDEAQTEKWLNRKRERSESQDSQHSQP